METQHSAKDPSLRGIKYASIDRTLRRDSKSSFYITLTYAHTDSVSSFAVRTGIACHWYTSNDVTLGLAGK
jgi:hypothetical protein